MWLTLLIMWFHMCKFASLLKVICSLPINTHCAFLVFHRLCRAVKSSRPWWTRSPLSWNKAMLPSCFDSHTVNKCPFCHLLSATLSSFLCFSLVISLLKWPSYVVLTCLSVTPSAGMLWCAGGENRYFRCASFRHEWQCWGPWVQRQWINNIY